MRIEADTSPNIYGYNTDATFNVTDTSKELATELHSCVRYGDLDGLVHLLSTTYPDLEAVDEWGRTPLEVATYIDRFDIVDTLIDAGALWDKPFTTGDHLINKAVAAGKTHTVGLLLEYGENPNCCGATKNQTPLHSAVSNNDYSMVELLLSYYANPNLCNSWTYFGASGTPLHLALEKKNTSIINLLILSGSDLNMTNGWGETPLHIAAHYGASQEVLSSLVWSGARIDTMSPCSRMTTPGTPFHVAIGRGNVDTARFLVELGTDYLLLNPKNKDAMQIAIDAKQKASINYLETLGFYQ